jgi:hypothetical protein
MFDAAKTLLFNSGHEAPVAQDTGGGVAVVSVQAENNHGTERLTRGQAAALGRLPHSAAKPLRTRNNTDFFQPRL